MSSSNPTDPTADLFSSEAFEQIPGQISLDTDPVDPEPAARPTYRERRAAKADRLREWAGKREQTSSAMLESVQKRAELIPLGEPIHSRTDRNRREKIWNQFDRAHDIATKGAQMTARADGIERQTANAIYSDDADAIERLAHKVETLERQGDAIKSENAAYRKAHRVELKAMPSAWERDNAMPHRSYELTNLGATIRIARERIIGLEREAVQGPTDRIIVARRDGACETCGADLHRGQNIRYNRQQGARCVTCADR